MRQPWFNSSKMAEINVPAWPIPIHQTKLTIANPQATGILMPHTPRPRYSSQDTDIIKTCNSNGEMANPVNHPMVGLRRRTISVILVVTPPSVCRGSITGAISVV
ncbi:MAG: hypothetical protein NVSMB56_20730 [Pyrinomonadaceae bacterium]